VLTKKYTQHCSVVSWFVQLDLANFGSSNVFSHKISIVILGKKQGNIWPDRLFSAVLGQI